MITIVLVITQILSVTAITPPAVLIVFSAQTPSSLRLALTTARPAIDSPWRYSEIIIDASHDLFSLLSSAGNSVIFDATYSDSLSLQLAEMCFEASIPLFTFGPHKNVQWKGRPYCLHGDLSLASAALTTLIRYFGFGSVNVLSDLSEESVTVRRYLLESDPTRYDAEAITDEIHISKLIGKVVRPKGNRVTVLTTAPALTKRVLASQKDMHVGGVGYANVLPLFSVLSTDDVNISARELEGCLILAPAGLETASSDSDYFSSLAENAFRSLRESPDLESVRNMIAGATPNSLFSVINVQNGKRVVVGAVRPGLETTITGQVVFLGNSTVVPNNSTASIPVSGNFGNLDPMDAFYPMYYFFWGTSLAMADINQRNDILQSFSMDLWNFTAGYMRFDSNYIRTAVIPYRDKFGAAIFESVSSSHTMAFSSFLMANNVTTPIIGSVVTHPMLSSKRDFPYFIRTCISDDQMNLATIQILERLGWTKFGIIVGNSSLGLASLDALQKLANDIGISIVNDPKFRVLPKIESLTEAAQNYTDALKHFVDTRARVLVVIDPIIARVVPMVLYDLGLRQGDVVIIAREWLMNNFFYFLDPVSFSKTAEILSGSLQFTPDRFVGSFGNSVFTHFQSKYETQPSSYACFYYDSTLALAYALDWLIQSGSDYMDSAQMMTALRTTRFIGCSGTVSFDTESNDRSSMRYLLETMKFTNRSSLIAKAGVYDPQGVTLLSIDAGFEWGSGGKAIPSDTRVSTIGCPFEDRLISDFHEGRIVFYSISAAFVGISLVVTSAILKFSQQVPFLRLVEKREIMFDDFIVMLGVLIDTLQSLALSPSFQRSLDLLREFTASTAWNFDTSQGLYERLLVVALTCVGFWCALKVGLRVWSASSHFCTRMAAERLTYAIENWLFVPILSVLLKSFACVHGVSDYQSRVDFSTSFLEADCNVTCWRGIHLVMAVLSAIAVAIYLPGAIYSRPLWQSSADSLNIHTSHRFVLGKSVFQVMLVIIAEVLRRDYPVVQAVSFLGIWIGFIGFSACVPAYGYKRTHLWHFTCMTLVLWSSFVSLLQLATDSTSVDLAYVGLVAGGWGAVLIFTFVYQCFGTQALLYRKKGIDTLYLFKFAFQPAQESVVRQLEVEFERTGHSRRVSLRIPNLTLTEIQQSQAPLRLHSKTLLNPRKQDSF